MKGKIILSLMLASVLGGCSSGEVNESVSSDNTLTQSEPNSSQENTQTKEQAKKDVTESFAPVFDDVKTAMKSDIASQPGEYKVIEQQLATSIIEGKTKVEYALYDINKDGIDELVLGEKSESDGQYYPLALYYLNNDKPKQIADNLAVMGYRSGFVLYQDGTIFSTTWGSGNGEGEEYLYKIAPSGTSLDTVASRKFTQLDWQLQKQNGLKEDQRIDPNNLDWKEVK